MRDTNINSLSQKQWFNNKVNRTFQGQWVVEGGNEATISITDGGSLTVNIGGFNKGTGETIGGGDIAAETAEITFPGYNNDKPIRANLRTPNLIYWDGFEVYWQRK